jgi:hypothetical protein
MFCETGYNNDNKERESEKRRSEKEIKENHTGRRINNEWMMILKGIRYRCLCESARI